MFGYWGWGNSTEQLIKSVDAVERARGWKPPIFVDIRIHRSVRAIGFANDNFQTAIGRSRYRWMPDLGNVSKLASSKTRGIQIKAPAAATELLEYAQLCAKRRRHVIYFCSCARPRHCHRYVVAKLLIRAALRRNVSLEVVEWPGETPPVTPTLLLTKDLHIAPASRLHVQTPRPLSKYAGMPFGTLIRASTTILATGPIRYAPTGWYLPVVQNDNGIAVRGTQRAAAAWRRRWGYEPLRTP